ncbi:sugar ABC transporter permease [Escherichia coli]|uniref:Sugar ABC transporter permease n=1 Tax=Escherichia coli TaxID=562 RepID=A0A376L1D6_ECOLX|nr:sugar ABC transporter permease [Escherichia coli]
MAELKKRHEFWLALLIVVLFVGLAWPQRRVSDIR